MFKAVKHEKTLIGLYKADVLVSPGLSWQDSYKLRQIPTLSYRGRLLFREDNYRLLLTSVPEFEQELDVIFFLMSLFFCKTSLPV